MEQLIWDVETYKLESIFQGKARLSKSFDVKMSQNIHIISIPSRFTYATRELLKAATILILEQ